MDEKKNDPNDLGNIDLSDKDENNDNPEIILFECVGEYAKKSIFSVLGLPELK